MNYLQNRLLIPKKSPVLTSRLSAACMRVLQSDTQSARGERKMELGELGGLVGFEFVKGLCPERIFAGLRVETDAVSGKLTASLGGLIPAAHLSAPEGASHFRLLLGLGRIDLENGKTALQVGEGEYLEVGGLAPIELPSYVFLWDASGNSLHLALLTLRFYQWLNEGFYPLHEGDCSVVGWVG